MESLEAKGEANVKFFSPCLWPWPRTHQPAVRQLRLSQDPFSSCPCPALFAWRWLAIVYQQPAVYGDYTFSILLVASRLSAVRWDKLNLRLRWAYYLEKEQWVRRWKRVNSFQERVMASLLKNLMNWCWVGDEQSLATNMQRSCGRMSLSTFQNWTWRTNSITSSMKCTALWSTMCYVTIQRSTLMDYSKRIVSGQYSTNCKLVRGSGKECIAISRQSSKERLQDR